MNTQSANTSYLNFPGTSASATDAAARGLLPSQNKLTNRGAPPAAAATSRAPPLPITISDDSARGGPVKSSASTSSDASSKGRRSKAFSKKLKAPKRKSFTDSEADSAAASDSAAPSGSPGSAPSSKLSKRLNGWNERYNELVQYKQLHGNCNVPSGYQQNPALSQWVKRQRYQHRLKLNKEHTNLTEERYEMLQRLGFVWNAHEANWEESFSQLLKFKSVFGHCRVPTKYPANQQLSVWVKLQRRQFRLLKSAKASSMTDHSDKDASGGGDEDHQNPQKSHITWDRVTRLNDIGFEWDPRKLNNSKSKQKIREINISKNESS